MVNLDEQIIKELRGIKKEVVTIKKQIALNVAFGIVGGGIILGILNSLF